MRRDAHLRDVGSPSLPDEDLDFEARPAHLGQAGTEVAGCLSCCTGRDEIGPGNLHEPHIGIRGHGSHGGYRRGPRSRPWHRQMQPRPDRRWRSHASIRCDWSASHERPAELPQPPLRRTRSRSPGACSPGPPQSPTQEAVHKGRLQPEHRREKKYQRAGACTSPGPAVSCASPSDDDGSDRTRSAQEGPPLTPARSRRHACADAMPGR